VKQQVLTGVEFTDDADEEDVARQLGDETPAVVSGTDWTTETIVSQLKRGNIQLNPRFQRRDAWKIDHKSRFIESLIVGLPVPQIVLAESKQDRGKFIVLDGKQRLLSILQFWGGVGSDNDKFRLSGLSLRKDLKKLSFEDLESDSAYEKEYNSLTNQTIRTVVIRSWKDTDFLHTVFLRLNTGSLKLSPQELRQALLPGKFTEQVEEAAGRSIALRTLLGIDAPDARMRDVEILARFLAFRFFATQYPGRMKRFLDESFEKLNSSWGDWQPQIDAALKDFDAGVEELLRVFGDGLARKPGSPQFNRAIFDSLIYFHSQPKIRKALSPKKLQLKAAYANLFENESAFSKSIESDTAGAPNTSARLRIWASVLRKITGTAIKSPKIPVAESGQADAH
jgi:hypothetical protein